MQSGEGGDSTKGYDLLELKSSLEKSIVSRVLFLGL